MVNRDTGRSRERVGALAGGPHEERRADDEPVPVSGAAPIVPVILSGGVGTRLWPLSRSNMPKQVLPLWGSEPMILSAAKRMAGITSEPPIVICGDDQRLLVTDALGKDMLTLGSLILEPQGRNTAPAIAVAALKASAASRDVMLVVQPSDHVVTDLAAFKSAVRRACQIAAHDGRLVLLGARPTSVQTGYGYIECGARIDSREMGYSVKRFVEKPDVERAAQFVRSGAWLWNVGIFVFTARAILDELAELKPELLDRCRAAIAQGKAVGSAFRLDGEAFRAANRFPSIMR